MLRSTHGPSEVGTPVLDRTGPFSVSSPRCSRAPERTLRHQTVADVPIARFHQVDEHLYRVHNRTNRPDPTARLRRSLPVINIRDEGDAAVEDERRIVESLGMRFVHIPIKDGNIFNWSRRYPGAKQ
jgi:hypothetical protein